MLPSVSPALGLCQSPTFLCYSWSVYSFCSGELSSPPPLSLFSLSLSCLISQPANSSPSGALLASALRRAYMGVPHSPESPSSMFLLEECSVRSVSFRAPPSFLCATPHPPLWARVSVCVHACDCESWRGPLNPTPCLGDADLRPTTVSWIANKTCRKQRPRNKVYGTLHQGQSPVYC